jgi:hypothetical protein
LRNERGRGWRRWISLRFNICSTVLLLLNIAVGPDLVKHRAWKIKQR